MKNYRKIAYAWSGGKDAQVLRGIMELVGIRKCVLVICELEYPAFMQWVTENMPIELEIINLGYDLPWLKKHEHMLFPQDAAMASKWFKIVQQKGLKIYFKKHDLDVLVLGRRKKDGNYVGKNGMNIYRNKDVLLYSPLSDWTHEEVFGFLHYYKYPLPPNYSWPDGFRVGTGPWAARQYTGSIANGWRQVYSIDPHIVLKAAEYFPSAAACLRSEGLF